MERQIDDINSQWGEGDEAEPSEEGGDEQQVKKKANPLV